MSERAGASDSLRDREPELPATPSADERPQPPPVNDLPADSLEPLVRQVLSTLGC
jgi:hypothetical protein